MSTNCTQFDGYQRGESTVQRHFSEQRSSMVGWNRYNVRLANIVFSSDPSTKFAEMFGSKGASDEN